MEIWHHLSPGGITEPAACFLRECSLTSDLTDHSRFHVSINAPLGWYSFTYFVTSNLNTFWMPLGSQTIVFSLLCEDNFYWLKIQ